MPCQAFQQIQYYFLFFIKFTGCEEHWSSTLQGCEISLQPPGHNSISLSLEELLSE